MPAFNSLRVLLGRDTDIIEKGWAISGNAFGGRVTSIHVIEFLTDTTAVASSSIPTGTFQMGGACSAAAVYVAGGVTTGYVNNIMKMIFSTEVTSTPSANLATARGGCAGVQSDIRGYYLGGHNPSGQNQVDGIRFDTDAAINPSATITTARGYTAQGAATNILSGYKFGGYNNSVYSKEIDKLTFSGETTASVTAQLSTAGGNFVSHSQDAIRAFITSGTSAIAYGGGFVEIQKMVFSTEAVSVITAEADEGLSQQVGVSSSIKGYWLGGTDFADEQDDLESIQFDTETYAHVNGFLPVEKNSGVGGQQWTQY